MSSARDHAVGGAKLRRGGDDAIVAGSDVLAAGAMAAGGAELVHPMPLGQDGHDGIFPSGDEQQSTPSMAICGCIDGAWPEGACPDLAAPSAVPRLIA